MSVHHIERGRVGHTLGTVRDLIIGSAFADTACLHRDIPSPCQQNWDGDEGIAGGAPEVLDNVVLGPLVYDTDLAFGAVS